MKYLSIDFAFHLTSFCSSFQFHWDPSFSFHGEIHDFWEVVYVEEGMVEVTEDAKVYTMTTGQFLLHAPMEFHKIRSAGGTFPKVRVLSFSLVGELPEVLKEGVFSLTEKDQTQYTELHSQIHKQFHADSPEAASVQACANSLSAFLIHLSHANLRSEQLSSSRDTGLYSNAVAVLTEYVNQNLTMAQLAKLCNISESYLKILFNRYAGISPKAYYDHQRCNRAILLLQQGKTIMEITDSMQFSSVNYFSVFFKRMTGLPPATFLKNTTSTQCL